MDKLEHRPDKLELEHLPDELKLEISKYLHFTSPEDLKSLSEVNKKWNNVATDVIYKNIHLQLSSREKLLRETTKLEGNQAFLKNVRYLRVWGNISKKPPASRHSAHLEQDDAELGVNGGHYPPKWTDIEDQAVWSPLVSLIKKCSSIENFEWACENQFPPSLLQVIEEKHPNCLLHVRMLRLYSLTNSGVEDDYERKLIQHPQLHNVSVRWHPRTTELKGPSVDYNGDAIYEIVKASSRLKHVQMIPNKSLNPESPILKSDWKGFHPPLDDSKGPACLSSLMLVYNEIGLRWNDLQKWSECIDLSKIQFLTLAPVMESMIFTYLKENVNFGSLEMLDIGIMSNGDLPSLLAEAESLFSHLKPLKEVCLSGLLTNSLLEEVFKRHGQALRSICLRPEYDEWNVPDIPGVIRKIGQKEILKIQSTCPQLYRLEILVDLQTSLIDVDDMSNICPNLPNLKELILFSSESTDKEGDPVRSRELVDIINKIWNLIRKKRTGRSLGLLGVFLPYVSQSAKSPGPNEKLTIEEPTLEKPMLEKPAIRPFGSIHRKCEYLYRALPEASKFTLY